MYSFKSLLTKKALPKLGLSLGKWLLCLMMLGIMDVNIHNLSAQILYQESFESGANGWTKVVGPFGRNSSWELGTPSASVINSASDGTQAWATNLDGNHNFNEQSAVLGPNIDLGSAVNPILSLDVYWETVFFQDGAFLEVSTNGTTFTRLGVDPDFYNGQAGFGGSNFVPAWTGSNSDLNGSDGWVTVSADLSAFVGQTIRLRVVFRSAQDILGTGDTGLNGFAFDNVRISNGVPSLKINAFPYAESFERSNGGWVSAPDFNFAVTNSWELNTPSGLLFFGASDGNYAWTTSSTALGGQDSYFDSELSQVLSPCFDFSALTSPQLSFDIWWETTFSLDGGALQYSTDNGATWTFVDANFVVTDGAAGYNGIVFDDFGISELGFIPAWTGDAANALGSNGYVPVEVDLSFLAGTPTVNFRFLFISDASEENLDGIAFDNVKIEEASVVEPLAIAAIEDITVNTDAGVCSATVTLPEAVVTGGVAPINVSNDAPASFELGETTVTYTATDANGTSVSTSFTVTVNDRENPVFAVCPQNISASASFGSAGAVVTYDAPEATDNCSAFVIVTLLEGLDSGETFPIGETTVSYIAVDEAGNSAECIFTVTVTEGQPAELSIAAIEDITVSNDPGVCGATVTLPEAQVTGGEGEITVSNDAPETFPVGTTTVTVTATDGAGQTVSTSFDVTVNDTEAPVFTAGVDDLFLSTDAPSEIFLLDPVVSDNCPDATFELVGGLANGSVFPVGITKQTYEATDASGNKTQACYNIGLLPLVQDLPYSQDFEAGNGGFAAGTPGCAQTNSWSLVNGVYSNGLESNENSFVISPFFLLDELSQEEPTISVDVNYALGTGDFVVLETSIDGGFEWNELISFSGSNNTTLSANLSSLLSGPGVAITLFRFRVEADATADAANNFSFDNFRIFDAAATPQITGFTLINSLTEGDIAPLNDGDVIVSNELPADLINIRADIDGSEVGSVGFELTGPNLGVSPARFENVAPFALFGDVNSNYNGVRLKPGQYTLKATAYSGANGEGSELSSAEITFTIILNTTPQIAEIVLFNAETDKEVAVLTDGAQIDLSQVGTNNLTIVARTSPKTVGSVKLALSGPLNINRVENLAPYALFGDSNNSTGDLFGQAFTAGSYTITATAYTESNATGANSSQTVQFELIGGTALTVFPNITSSSSRTTVKREGINNSGKAIVLTITDMLGRTMGTATIQVGKDSTVLNLNNVPEGQYIISDGVSQTRMTVEN